MVRRCIMHLEERKSCAAAVLDECCVVELKQLCGQTERLQISERGVVVVVWVGMFWKVEAVLLSCRFCFQRGQCGDWSSSFRLIAARSLCRTGLL